MPQRDATQRFSDRVQQYLRYRPGYPAAVLDLLVRGCRLSPRQVIADVGCGTGLLSELFLDNGNRVFGVEPNDAMREAGARALQHKETFTSLPGSAEQTGLEDHSVDLVAAGQAFHWFDVPRARKEFLRILTRGGRVALVWNQRDMRDDLQRDYDALLRKHLPDYEALCHHRLDQAEIAEFFGGDPLLQQCPNEQVMDLEGFLGRASSSSYVPKPGQPGHQKLFADLHKLFIEHEVHGTVPLRYRTVVFAGQLQEP